MLTNRSRSKPNTTTATRRRRVPFLALAHVQGLSHFSSVQPRRAYGLLLLSLKRCDVRHRGSRTSHLFTEDGRPNILFSITHSDRQVIRGASIGGIFDTNSVRPEGKSVYIFGAYDTLTDGKDCTRNNPNERQRVLLRLNRSTVFWKTGENELDRYR
ncbi:hypothetical protein ACI65C_011631 [Semiaphis heraclei]